MSSIKFFKRNQKLETRNLKPIHLKPTGLIAFFIFFSAISFAQNTATVFGKLVNADQEPLEDMQISVLGSTLAPVYSDKDGNFEYKIPANADLEIVFSNLSYNQQKKTVNLKPGQRFEINLLFTLNAKIILQGAEVTDNLRTTNTMRIDPKIVTFIPSASGDFNAILFSQPGVSSRNELSSSYSVRGGNYDENLVYVNDIEVYRPFLVRAGQQEGLSFVNTDLVSSVLFSAGGFEAKYGDKLSSVLDIKYRRPRKFNGTASASLLGGNVHAEGASKDFRFTWLLGARYKTSRYILGKTDVQGDYRPSFIDLQTYLTYDISDKWEIDFLGMYANNKYNLVPQTRETQFGTVNQALRFLVYFDGQEIDRYETGQAALSAVYHSGDHLQLKFISSAYKTAEDETFDILGQYYIDQLENDFGKSTFGQVKANLGVGTFLNHARNYLDATVINVEHKGVYAIGKNQVLWGAKVQHEMITDRLSEWNYIDSAGYSLPQNNNEITLQNVLKSKNEISSERLSGFTQYIWNKDLRDTSTLTATAGVRANYWSLNQQTVISPRLTLAFKPNWKRDFLFRASSGFYYQPPFYRELRDLNGVVHTDVKAQQSIHFLVASDYNFKLWRRPFKFIAEAYYKVLNDLIPYEIDNVRIRYFANNSAKGYATGMDFKINGEFVKGLESWFSLSLLQTKEDIKGDYYYDYYNSDGEKIVPGYTNNIVKKDSVRHEPGYIPRPTDQLVNFTLFFQDYLPKFPDFKMHLQLLFGTSLPFGPPTFQRYKDTLRMPPYRRVDIGFSYQLIKESKKLPAHNPLHNLKSVWIGLEVLNLLQVNNTISYYWVKDVTNRTYAIPNYLTNRQLNLRVVVKF